MIKMGYPPQGAAAPPVHIKDIWDFLAAEAVKSGSLGKLLADYVDAKISLAKADLTTLETRLNAARAGYLDNLNNAQLLNVPDLSTLSAAKIGYLGKAPGVAGSDVLLASNDAEVSHNTTTYTKKKEFVVLVGGKYRVTFDLKRVGSASTVYGQIYKDGVALGTEQSTISGMYVTKTEDLALEAGCLCQLYLKVADPADESHAINFRLKGDVSSEIAVVTV